MKNLLTIVLILLCFSACNNDGRVQIPDTQNMETIKDVPAPVPETPKEVEFNEENKDIYTNGNRKIAYEKIAGATVKSINASAKTVSISSLTKSPYTYLGKLIRLRGQVAEVEQMPPGESHYGSWYSVLLVLENANNKVGVTTVNFHYYGTDIKVEPDSYATFSGYFVGTYESHNMYGGQVTGFLIIGNYIN